MNIKKVSPVVGTLFLAACALPGLEAPNSPASVATSNEAAVAAAPAKIDDADEGVTQPMQSAHEQSFVFSNRAIARTGADEKQLVKTTTLDKPLYVRAFLPKTPMRLLAENSTSGKACPLDDVTLDYVAWLGASKDPKATDVSYVILRHAEPSEDVYKTSRSASLANAAGTLISINPQTKVQVMPERELEPEEVFGVAFSRLVAQMKPGANTLNVGMMLICKSNQNGKNGSPSVVASVGSVEVQVANGDVAKYAKRVALSVPASSSAEQEKFIKPRYQKTLVAGAKLLSFGVGVRNVVNTFSGETPVRMTLKYADGTCGYQQGIWTQQQQLVSNTWSDGEFVTTVDDTRITLPCP